MNMVKLKCPKCGKDNKIESKFCHHCGTKNEVQSYNTINTESSNIGRQYSRNKKIGLFLIIAPIAGLILILSGWAVASFVIGQMVEAGSASESAATIANIINVALGFLGIICVLGIFIGIPLGIIYISKKDIPDDADYDKRSGKKEQSEIPQEISGWNWGAFGLSIIWGLYHRVWLSLLCLIPLIGWIVAVYLGVKGNELAWKKNRWLSVEKFKISQNKWKIWGILGFILSIIYLLINIGSALNNSDEQYSNYNPTSEKANYSLNKLSDTPSLQENLTSDLYTGTETQNQNDTGNTMDTLKTDDVTAFLLLFQETADMVVGEGQQFRVDSIDPKLQEQFMENGSDVPLMRYLGRKGLNNIESNDIDDRIDTLKTQPAYNAFSGSVDKLEKSLMYLKRFYTAILDLRSFEEFKMDMADFGSHIDNLYAISETMQWEYTMLQSDYPNLNYTMFGSVAGLIIEQYKRPEEKYITLDTYNNYYSSAPIKITGRVTSNTQKIVVKASGAGYVDNYELQNYIAGNTTFQYQMKEDWNNLQPGINEYFFTAYFDDGASDTVYMKINYTPRPAWQNY